jgi:hypothetical protein
MSDTAEVLSEVYSILKEYISSKDRQAAADHVLSILVDLAIGEQEIKQFCASDRYLKQSYDEYFHDADEDPEEETDYDYDQDD